MLRRQPEREETSLCLDHVRNLLEAQVKLVNNGKNKEVEKNVLNTMQNIINMTVTTPNY